MSARRGTVALTGAHAHSTKGQTDAANAARRAQAYELRLRGLTLRQIAEKLGVSDTTVHKDLKAEIHGRLDPLKDQYLQYELDRLDHMQQAALLVLENPGTVVIVPVRELDEDGKPTVRMVNHVIVDDRKILGAIDRLVRISESRRKLVGLDAPVKVQADVQVTETTQEDLELQELLREAKVKAAASMEFIRQNGGTPA